VTGRRNYTWNGESIRVILFPDCIPYDLNWPQILLYEVCFYPVIAVCHMKLVSIYTNRIGIAPDLIARLCSPAADTITGLAIPHDGGWRINRF